MPRSLRSETAQPKNEGCARFYYHGLLLLLCVCGNAMSEYEKDKADLLKSGELMNGYKGKIVFTKRNQPGDPMHGFIAMHRESETLLK